MLKAMNKSVAVKDESKGTVHKHTGEFVIHKVKAGQGAVRERSAVSGRSLQVVRRPAPIRRKVSAYTREEADWLNALVHSAANGAINKG